MCCDANSLALSPDRAADGGETASEPLILLATNVDSVVVVVVVGDRVV